MIIAAKRGGRQNGGMANLQSVDEFLDQEQLAIVGVSRNGKGFGAMALRELKARGYQVHVVHPEAKTIGDDTCYASLADLPEGVGGLLIVVPPAQTEKVVRDAAAAGISRVWMQQGAQSADAVRYCAEHGIDCISGECILMFVAPDRFPHNLHRWIWRKLGKLPA